MIKTIPVCSFNLKRLTREVNILLISDLHYDTSEPNAVAKRKDARRYNKQLLAALPPRGSEWEPDIVIIAGDLVNQNKTSGYELYFEFIKSLTDKYPVLKDAVFSTPGNHDINRNNIVSAYPYLYSLQKNAKDLRLDDSYTQNKIIDTLYTVTKKPIDDVHNLVEALCKFEGEYFKTFLEKKAELSRLGITRSIPLKEPVPGLRTFYTKSVLGLKLVSLNSSFFCNLSLTPSDRNNLFFVNAVIKKVLDDINDPKPVIAFMHHPFYYLHESEHIAPEVGDLLAAYHNNFTKVVEKSDLILSGHVHGELRNPSVLHQKSYMISNGTTFTHEQFLNKCYPYTFALIKVNKPLNRFSLRKAKYDPATLQFKLDSAEKAAYYNFLRESQVQPINAEWDKVALLYYLMQLPGYSPDLKNGNFLFYQLNMYDPGLFGSIKKIDWVDLPAPARVELSWKNKKVLIYYINNNKVFSTIEAVVRDLPPNHLRYMQVYFSVDINKLVSTDLSQALIDSLVSNYRILVQTEKKHYININLLYHLTDNRSKTYGKKTGI